MTLIPQSYPILEFDPDRDAILKPQMITLPEPPPERTVLCFFQDVLAEMAVSGELTQIHTLGSERGPNPVYRLDTPDGAVMVMHPGVGAPLAAGFMEEIISMGARKLMACGGCGALKPDIDVGHLVVVTSAVRDEGTSYHYLPPAREIEADPAGVIALETALTAHGVPYRLAKTWTTDAFFRETPAKRDARLAEGCEVVEMEASAFMAVARFRGATFGQLLYGGDLVVPEGWDHRSWVHRGDVRRFVFDLAVDAVLRL